ncbi:unnamed protein product [Protopolystoma xenopodis]|uniref:Uncharacterized protein n=1 Tax=Protopolystoma xenopodis TaxID=117903 RepID=A0A3S5CBF1_9PLAT|nr:unnamed protein product [Protopolystoma xenopodis]
MHKTNTRFTFTVGYILAWMAVATAFLSSWFLFGSTCCWTYSLPDTLIDEYFSYLDSGNLNNGGFIGWGNIPLGLPPGFVNTGKFWSSLDGGMANMAYETYDGNVPGRVSRSPGNDATKLAGITILFNIIGSSLQQ